MADSYSVKKITELTENTISHDTDLFVLGNEGTSTMRKVSFANLANWVKTKIGALVSSDIVNDTTTGGVNKVASAETVKDLQTQVTACKTWTSLGSTTGTTQLTIPAGATELSVRVQYTNTSTCFSFHLVKANLLDSASTFSTGYYINASGYSFVQIVASKTAVSLGTLSINGVAYTSTSHMYVYYR